MNTDTGQVRAFMALTEKERASGVWVPISDDLAAAASALGVENATARLRQMRKANERQLEGLRKPGRR